MNSEGTITLRPAATQDLEYAWRLYVTTIREYAAAVMSWNETQQRTSFAAHWQLDEVRIIVADGSDIGWLQTGVIENTIFLKHLYIDPSCQRMGYGTRVMATVIAEAASKNMPVALAVMRNNPARRLYSRLGFRATHSDEYKFYMQRDL